MKQIHKIYRKSAIEFAMLYNKVDRSNAQLYSNYELSEILHEATGNRYQIINDMFIEENTEQPKDCNGTLLFEGDHVDDRWAGELIVCRFDNGDYYGKLVCEPGHSCENIPYALNTEDITKIDKTEQ